MKPRHRRSIASIVATATLFALAASSGGPVRAGGSPALPSERSASPEDRYAMAGGCYTIRSLDTDETVIPFSGGYRATGHQGEAFHFQATGLGRYLLMDSAGGFVAAREGVAGTAANGITGGQSGGLAGGLSGGATDTAGDTVRGSQANTATGRGASVVTATTPSELADWRVDQSGPGAFTITLPATGGALAIGEEGRVVLGATESAGTFAFDLTEGCASFPEIEVNVDGPALGGGSVFAEVSGYMDLHLHMMAFEFLGGRARCGRPWHPYGVAFALVDCPDHMPGGHGAVLEMILSGGDPVNGHNTDGWPTFAGWPRYNSLTHEQIYYRWLERAWRGGLRMFVNLLVDNNQLCKIYPFKVNSCNEMDGVRLQAKRINELQDYIDAQAGGPGEGWFRIVRDPFEARAVMNQGKLAVVLGIEVSVPLDCGLLRDLPRCTADDVDQRLDEVYDLGVRQMELTNKFDNAFSGVTGDAGDTGIVVNQGNFGDTGSYWRMETCTEEDGEARDKLQHNFHDNSGAPDQFSGRDSLVGGILALSGSSGVAPVYPEGPHCNVLGLSELGETMIRGMAERGMIFDPDHMSARGRTQAMDLIEEMGYSGVVSSHGWADDTIYPRVYEAGGVVAPYGGGSSGFVANWRKHRAWRDPRFTFGFGYGADTNGFGSQGAPRGAAAPNKVTYPFSGFGGTTIHQQTSGTKVYDVNTSGVAHYGLYPDWIEDARRVAGADGGTFLADMARGPEAYLQMWERAIGIAGDACRSDVGDITDARLDALEIGTSTRAVIEALGQPNTRTATAFTFCATGGRTATVSFTAAGGLSGIVTA